MLSLPRALRICLSASAIGLLLAGAIRLRQVNGTTVALALVLIVVGIAQKWGGLEALIAAFVAALGLDYFFLPPGGFGMDRPEHWVAYFAFIATALATGQLSARAKRHEVEAVSAGGRWNTFTGSQKRFHLARRQIPSSAWWPLMLVEILHADCAAVYYLPNDRISIAGARRGDLDPCQIRKVAATGDRLHNTQSHVSVEPFREDGRLSGSIGVACPGFSGAFIADISERVGAALSRARVTESLRQAEISRRADELKSAVFDALAHEAKGPLGSINIAATTLLSHHPGSPEQQREMLTGIREEVARLNRWIDDTTRIGRTEPSGLALTTAARSLSDLVGAALEPLAQRLHSRRLELLVEEPLPLVECDPEMTQRVLNLLLDNALKYSPPGTPIAISASLNENTVVVSVSDEGPGVPEHEHARIFEKHYRGSQHRSSVPGTGMGLASAKYLVESQGGDIWVADRPGNGAVFHFSLPLAKEAQACGR